MKPGKLFLVCSGLVLLGLPAAAQQSLVHLRGQVRDLNGSPVSGATVRARGLATASDEAGRYDLALPPGLSRIEVGMGPQTAFRIALDVEEDRDLDVTLRAGDTVEVRAEQDALLPDPATQGYAHVDLLDANPGRPGVPVSVPGYPTETASGGIKAPQYFAPGVAGDHGEPIAQFFDVGGYLLQNNLTANAHGNGYADPNFVIGPTVGGVLVDNAGYNARYGDHSINLAVTYAVRDTLSSFAQMTTDGRDGALAVGWGSRKGKKSWIAAEALWGNGFLKRAEERQQYKLNAHRSWEIGHHELTAYGIGYYGFSRIPGLIPLDTPVSNDTIDARQADLTHTTLALVTDHWQMAEQKSLVSGAFFRTYSLALRSNFGDGLIRQSEFRTVLGGSSTYSQALSAKWLLLAGMEARREAPRGLELAHADAQGVFQPVTNNDLTITSASPFTAVTGRPVPHVQLYLGVRRDELDFNNRDLLMPANSFTRWPGVTSPKVNLTLGEPDAPILPQFGLSFGKAFHANDPRIGTGSAQGGLIIQARGFQMVARKEIAGTDVRLTLSKVTNSAELAKIDPDTGLQQDVGRAVDRFLTLSARRWMSRGWAQLSWSEADARDRESGAPIPEAPRTIVDAVGAVSRLPLGLDAKAEFEYVKAKPLGDGFTGVPVRELRLALDRGFADGRWVLSVNGQLCNGFSGQTLETLAVGAEPAAFERRAGVPLRSYAAASLNYRFHSGSLP